MQKKILASLLVAPLAMNALADITVNGNLIDGGNGWDQSGVSGANIFNEDGTVLCPIAGGKIAKNVTGLNLGEYRLVFGSRTNVEVLVSANGLPVATAAADNGVTFKVTEENTTLEITIQGEDKTDAFSFAGLRLMLDVNLQEYADALNQALGQVDALLEVTADDQSDEAKALRELYTELSTELTGIENKIAGIENPGDDELGVYNTYRLWEDPNSVMTSIKGYEKAVDAYNLRVKAENTLYGNTVARDALLAGVTTLENNLAAALTAIDGATLRAADKEALQTEGAAIGEAIAGYKSAVEAAYADLTKEDITVEDQSAALQARIDALNTSLDTAKQTYQADEAAAKALDAAMAELLTSLQNAYDSIDALKGVKGKETNFDGMKPGWKEELNKLYQEAMGSLSYEAGKTDGASANLEADMAAIEAAKTAIADKAQGYADYVAGQNQAYTDGVAAIGEKQSGLDAIKINGNLTDEEKAEYDRLHQAAQDAIDAVSEKLDNDYAAGNVEEPDFTAVDEAVSALDKFVVDNQPIVDLENALEKLKKDVSAMDPDGDKDGFNLYNKFTGSFAAIQGAIDALVPGSVSDEAIDNISTNIDNTRKNAQELIDAYNAANTALAGFRKLSDGLESLEKEKVAAQIEGSTWNLGQFTSSTEYTSFVGKLNEFNTAMANLKVAEAQAAFAQATALKAAIDNYGYENEYNKVLFVLESAGTDGNFIPVDAALKALEELVAQQVNGNDYEGQDAATSQAEGFRTEYENLASSFDALKNTDSQDGAKVDAKKYLDIDSKLKALLARVNSASDNVKTLRQNQADYDLLATYDDLQGLIDALTQYNQDNSMSPADKWYADNDTDKDIKAIQDALDAYRMALDKALTDHKVTDGKAGFEAQRQAIKDAVTDTYSAIDANNAAYNGQVAKSGSVRNEIGTIISELTESAADANLSDAQSVTEALDALQSLLDNDLVAEDLVASGYYGTGSSAANNTGVMNAYDEILKQANDIRAGVDVENLVKEANKAYTDKWGSDYNALKLAYQNAINTYNEYFLLDNARYRKFILTVVQSHKDIYDFYGFIENLNGTVTSAISGSKSVLTDDEYKTLATDAAVKLTADIAAKVELMQNEAKDAAEAYYNGGEYTYTVQPATENEPATQVTETVETGILANANAVIDDAKGAMTAAGISDEIQATFTGSAEKSLADGTGIYDKNKDDVSLGLAMNNVANYFDGISVDTAAAASAQWSATYGAAEEELASLKTRLEGITNPEIPEQLLLRRQLATLTGEAADVNTRATASNDLLGGLPDFTEELEGILEQARNLVNTRQDVFDADEANKAAFEECQATLNDLNSLYEALVAFDNKLAGNSDLGAIRALIDAYEKLFTEKFQGGTLKDNADVAAAETAARNAIEGGYLTVMNNEFNALGTLLNNTKEAFNNAQVADPKPELDFGELNADINELALRISALNNPENQKDKDAYATEAMAIEDALSAIYVEIRDSYTTPAGLPVLTEIQAELNGQYEKVAGEIGDGKTALDNCLDSVKEQFGTDYDDLATALEEVKDEYTALRDKLVIPGVKSDYMNRMEAIEEQLAELNGKVAQAQEEAEAEQARQQANDAAYTSLGSELDALEARVAALQEKALEYGVDNYDTDLENISGKLAEAREWLEEQKEAVALDADSTFPAQMGIGNLPGLLDTVEYNLEVEKCAAERTASYDALGQANDALSQNVVPSVKEAQKALYNALYDRAVANDSEANTLRANYLSTDPDTKISLEEFIAGMAGCVAEYEAIASEAEAIKDAADEAVFVPGDVDGTDGVTVLDLQQIIAWVGSGVTYDELMAADPVKAAAADITGDKVLNIADVSAEINLLMADDAATASHRVYSRRGVLPSEGVYGLALTGREDGIRDYVMTLTGAPAFTSAQMDLRLPAGMTLEGVALDSRAADHLVEIFDNGGGNYRLVMFSMSNSEFRGTDGELMHLSVSGVGTPEMSGVIVADADAHAMELKSAGTSVIEDIVNGATNMRDRIYNVAGQAMRGIQRGINIIRHGDGSVTKEIGK